MFKVNTRTIVAIGIVVQLFLCSYSCTLKFHHLSLKQAS
jgi:hypothetical protein